jgi:hypothetical protein
MVHKNRANFVFPAVFLQLDPSVWKLAEVGGGGRLRNFHFYLQVNSKYILRYII